jgi:hypothetical protein
MAKSELIEFNDIKYRRYPESKNTSDAKYFRCHKSNVLKGFGYLHRDVYKYHNGEIPEGYHVHHIDGDAGNNDMSNLRLISSEEHHRYHCDNLTEEQRQARRDHAARIRPLTKAWHASEEGRAWHVKNGKEMAANLKPRQYHCLQCGDEFYLKPFGENKFCSNKCKSAWRRASGVDNVVRICAHCGKEYTCDKYSKQKLCSKECLWPYRKSLISNSQPSQRPQDLIVN